MSYSNKLFQLIKSLDAKEKRYFKQYASRRTDNSEKNHIFLFDLLSKANEYNEEQIKTKFPAVGYTQFSQLKNYTYKHILAAMRSLNAEQTEERKLLNKLEDIEFLYNKGLLDDCNDLIQKSIKKASKLNSDNLTLILNTWNKRIRLRVMPEMEVLEQINKIDDDSFRNLKTSNWYQNTTNLLQTYVSTQYSHGTKYKDTPMPNIMSNKHMNSAPTATLNKVRYYQILTFNADFLGQNKKAITYTEKVLELFESNDTFKQNNYELYLNNLTNHLRNFTDEKSEVPLFELLKKQRIACERGKNIISAPAYADAIFISYFFEQRHHLNKFDYKKVLENLPDRIQLFEEIKKDLRIQYRLLALANTAIIYFNTGNYKECIRWSNRLMNDEELRKQRPEVYTSARILYLLSHYELGDFEFLLSASRSAMRYFKKHRLLKSFENTVIKMLRDLSKSKYSSAEVFSIFKKEFKKIENDPFVKVACEATGLTHWVESKIKHTKSSQSSDHK